MLHDLPMSFFGCLAGMSVGAGLTVWLCFRLLRKAAMGARLRSMARDEDGSAVVEFPFALLVLVVLTTLTCQLAFLTSGFVVVDYAAYCAVRCAIVTIPEDRSSKTPAEAANALDKNKKEFDKNTKGKGEEIFMAGVLGCYPIAGDYSSPSAWGVGAANDAMDKVNSVLPGSSALNFDFGLSNIANTIGDVSHAVGPVARMAYSYLNTDVKILSNYGAHDLITVEVLHWYSLQVPYADRILKDKTSLAAGYQAGIQGRASMLNEGEVGKKPPDPPKYVKPD